MVMSNQLSLEECARQAVEHVAEWLADTEISCGQMTADGVQESVLIVRHPKAAAVPHMLLSESLESIRDGTSVEQGMRNIAEAVRAEEIVSSYESVRPT